MSEIRHGGDLTAAEARYGKPKDGWLDLKGNPITEEARTTERIRRVDYGTLEVTITIDDPKAYTKPFTVKRYLKLKLDTELIDYICNENEKSLQHMVGK